MMYAAGVVKMSLKVTVTKLSCRQQSQSLYKVLKHFLLYLFLFIVGAGHKCHVSASI